MNFKSLLLAGSAALLVALTGCQQRDLNGGNTPAPEGTTYMSVSIRNLIPEVNRPRTITEDQSFNGKGEWAGRDKIQRVKVYIIDEENGTITSQIVEPKTGSDHSVVNTASDSKISDFKAWKTTPGNKTIYALINGVGTQYETDLDAATAATFATEYAKVVTMTTETGIEPTYGKLDTGKDLLVMTGAPAKLNVLRGVTKEQAEGGQNKASIEVRRGLAQAVVTQEKDKTFDIKIGETVIATLSDLTWAGAQYEKTEKGYEEKYLVSEVKTPSFDYIPAADTYSEAKDKYVYSLDHFKEVKPFVRAQGNEARTIMPQLLGTDFSEDNSIYLTETTHKLGGILAIDGGTGEETGYRKGNTPYFIVKAKITPADGAWAEGEKPAADTRAAMLRQNIPANDPAKKGDIHYVGGKFYSDLAKAKEVAGTTDVTESTAKDKVLTFKGGYCYYIYWFNPEMKQVNGVEKPVNSPIIRNNLYHVNITGFLKLGLTGNPLNPDPNDPNNPTPDPDDPNNPKPEEPLYDTDTYMTCEVNIVPWGVHSFDHEFK